MGTCTGIGAGVIFGKSNSWSSYWTTHYISELAVSTTSGTTQTIIAIIIGSGVDGISFEYSTDGITYTEKGTSINGTYNASGLETAILYYWRARPFKLGQFGNYSPIGQAVTLESFVNFINNDNNGISHWRMNEADGSTLVDSIDNNNASIEGGITLGTTITYLPYDSSKGITCDGSGYANIGNKANLSFTRTQPFTILAIVKPNVTRSGGATDYWIYSKANPSSPYNGILFGLRWNGSNKTSLVLHFGANYTSQYIYRIEANWDLKNTDTYLVIVTYDGSAAGSGVNFYLNYIKSTSSTVTGGTSDTIAAGQDTTNANNAEIGRRGSLNKWYKGDIKDLSIFSSEKNISWIDKLRKCINFNEILSPAYNTYSPKPQVLYDLDLDSDIDDVVDLLMMLNLEHLGEIDIKGCIVSSKNTASSGCLYSILNYYERTSIPIGVNTSALGTFKSAYVSEVVAAYGVEGKTSSANFDNYIIVARTILASAENNSIEYITTGSLSSVKGLLESPPDGISSLTGVELFAAKVRNLFIVGGIWPTGAGISDISLDNARATVSQYVLSHVPNTTSIILCSITDGDTVRTGASVMVALNANNPAREAWNQYFDDLDPVDTREGWSQIAILPLARGFINKQKKGIAYMLIKGANGTASINTDTLVSSFTTETNSNHHYMGKFMSDADLVATINSLIKDKTEW